MKQLKYNSYSKKCEISEKKVIAKLWICAQPYTLYTEIYININGKNFMLT